MEGGLTRVVLTWSLTVQSRTKYSSLAGPGCELVLPLLWRSHHDSRPVIKVSLDGLQWSGKSPHFEGIKFSHRLWASTKVSYAFFSLNIVFSVRLAVGKESRLTRVQFPFYIYLFIYTNLWKFHEFWLFYPEKNDNSSVSEFAKHCMLAAMNLKPQMFVKLINIVCKRVRSAALPWCR